MVNKTSGIASLNPNVNAYLNTVENLTTDPASNVLRMPTDMDMVRQRENDLRSYLGSTDYSKQLEESQNMGKLQLGLALAQRGFAAAGATPRRGESSISTLSRELLSPIAGDAGSVASQMMKQRQAINLAKEQEARQLKLAALQKVEGDNESIRKLAERLMPTTTKTESKVGDTGIFRQITGKNEVGDNIYGSPVKTIRQLTGNNLRQRRVDTGEDILVGKDVGQYELYDPENPGGGSGKPTDDQKATDALSGVLSGLSRIQSEFELGNAGVRFDAKKFAANVNLEVGPNYPFQRVLGKNKNSGEIVLSPLSEEQQVSHRELLKRSFSNLKNKFKGGAGKDLVNVYDGFLRDILKTSLKDLGLENASEDSNVVPTDAQLSPSVIREVYKRNVKLANDGEQTYEEALQSSPIPIGNAIDSGFGRLKLIQVLSPNLFGKDTRSPDMLPLKPEPSAVVDRAEKVNKLDKGAIQKRIIAEEVAADLTTGAALSPQVANTDPKRFKIIAELVKEKEKKRREAVSSSRSKKVADDVSIGLNAIANMDSIDAAMKIGGSAGFVTGPINRAFSKRFGVDFGDFWETPEGVRRRKQFNALLPILEQFTARDLLTGLGEDRKTDRDLRGVQDTLVKINQDGGFNAASLRELRGYLAGVVKNSLESVGTYELPDSTLKRAAQLGVDVKSIKGQKGFYSPYLADQTYAVSKKPVPSYSKEYIEQLVDGSIFGYVAQRGGPSMPNQYRLFDIDETTKQPIPLANKKGFKTTLYPGVDGWQATVPGYVLDRNRAILKETYGLKR